MSLLTSSKEGDNGRFYHKAHIREAKDRAERDLKVLNLKIGVMWSKSRNPRSQEELQETKNRLL